MSFASVHAAHPWADVLAAIQDGAAQVCARVGVAVVGGLLFGGDTNGHFRAFDPETGAVLWDVNLGSPVSGYPISYSANGKQFIAVSTGNSLVSAGLARLTPEFHPSNSNAMFVFALP